jgi:DnaJ-class molecular chaperone
MSDNYYDILGVNENASQQEIKKAYRKLSMKWHPDKNQTSDAKGQFQKIGEAYETLGDDRKRNEYDMLNKNPFFKMKSNHMNMNSDVNIDEIFSSLFGGAFGMPGMMPGMMSGMPMPPGAKIHVFHGPNAMNFQQSLQKPSPIIKTIDINLENVLLGNTVPLEIERWTIEQGIKVFEKETIYVDIPRGIDDNEMIILRDKGNILNENCKGDVKLFVKVINNSLFKRSGLDIIIDKNITLKDALCGFSFEVKHLNGKSYTLNNVSGNIIPPEYKKIVPNMGLTRENHTGNMIIHFHIDFPEKLSIEQIKKLKDIL